MSEQNFTLTSGNVTPLTGALAAGATIINTSPTAAVWIGSSPNTGPGLGVRLGPKGSTTWNTDGAPVYACPDTGITYPVSVTVSSDMAPPVNPVDVGVAVAAQLLAQGVPSVLVGEPVPFGNLASVIDVSRYASLTVRYFVTAPTNFTASFTTDAAGLDVVGGRSIVSAESGYITFTIPVTGPYFVAATSTPGALFRMDLYGTNRNLGDSRIQNTTTGASVAPVQAWLAGNTTDLLMPIVTNGGRHRIRMAVTNSAKGYLYCTAWNEVAGAVQQFVVLDTGAGHASPNGAAVTETIDDVILPAGRLRLYFQSITAATFQVVCHVTPTP